jgi:hypothetical protein
VTAELESVVLTRDVPAHGLKAAGVRPMSPDEIHHVRAVSSR